MKIGVIKSKTNVNNNNYEAAVRAAGGEVVRLNPYISGQPVAETLSGLDGLVIPGGLDLQPSFYNEENTACGELDPVLDDYEMEVIRQAVSQRLPIFGICRGMQVLNVFFGGSLYQNIFCCEFHKKFENRDRVHETRVEEGSFLYKVYGSTTLRVNSAHHQAVKDLGKGLLPAQYSKEGLLEALYHEDLPIIAVQWHPERMCLDNAREDTDDGLKLFTFFMEMCGNI